MSTPLIRAAMIAAGAGALLVGAAAPAWAWPIPITSEEQRVIDQAHATGFPGDDDQMLMAARQACQMLMTGQGSQAATDTLAGRYGADPGQAAAVVRIAHGILCTSARG